MYPDPLPEGVGGWEHDRNDRLLPRPRLPVQMSLDKYLAALDAATIDAKVAYLDGKVEGYDGYQRALRESLERRVRKSLGTSWHHLKKQVFERDQGRCRRCRRKGFDVDHIFERWRGGADCLENLQLLCDVCHFVKGAAQAHELAVASSSR